MITSIAFFALFAPKAEPPLWAQDLLRAAPPSLARTPLPKPSEAQIAAWLEETRRTNPSGEHRSGNPGPESDGGLNQSKLLSIQKLVQRGNYEGAYQAALLACPDDRMANNGDVLVDTALITGRYAHAERILVESFRESPQPAESFDGGYIELSLAAAMQGRVYRGQGDYALRALRDSLKWEPFPARLKDLEGVRAPRTPSEIAAMNRLAFGLRRGRPYGAAFLKEILKKDPACELAAWGLVETADPERDRAESIGVAEGMVRNLPPGEGRDHFALRLAELRRGGS